jgi:hypothetical protein
MESNIPGSLKYFGNIFPGFERSPILFGNDYVSKDSKTITVEADIFASAFFMLTRWEEYIIQERDKNNRFPSSISLAFRKNFLDIPVVDIYAELLWEFLVQAGFKGERKQHEFRIFPTHDVDQVQYWNIDSKKTLFKNLSGDIFKRKNPGLSLNRFLSFFRSVIGDIDPCDTFNCLMDKAESVGNKACFYFISGGETEYENNYSIFSNDLKEIIKLIKNRGHIIGIHPSYNCYNNYSNLKEEVKSLSEISDIEISESRNHYLRFEIPYSWQILQQAGIKVDSSMYYFDAPGFRCGTCHEFPVFDIVQRKNLLLIERPLIVMDTSFRNMNHEAVFNNIRQLKETVKKSRGNFVFLWHNSNINTPEWKPLKRTFEEAFYG